MSNKFDDALAKTAQKDLTFKSSIEKASKLVETQQACIKDLDFFKVSASEAAMQNIENLALSSAKAEAALKDSLSAAMKALEPQMACLKQVDLISQASIVADAMKPFESIIEQRNIINNLFASAEQIRSKFSSANITNVFEEKPFLNAYSDILSDFVVSAKPIYDTTSDEDILCSEELDNLATETLSKLEEETDIPKHTWSSHSLAEKISLLISIAGIIYKIISFATDTNINIDIDININKNSTYNSYTAIAHNDDNELDISVKKAVADALNKTED